jgi:transposase
VSGERLALPRAGVARERLRLLLGERRSCQRARKQALNQLQAAIVTLDPPLRQELAQLRCAALIRSLAARRRPQLAALGRLAKRCELLAQELAEVDAELGELIGTLCPQLLREHGVGPVCAAQLLVSAAQPQRLQSEASFAALAGVSPVEASSGAIKRHRLNRGGDRQLNWALHMTALSRIRNHPETRRYYRQLQLRGKTKREAIRCVKRVVARRLYRTLSMEASAART